MKRLFWRVKQMQQRQNMNQTIDLPAAFLMRMERLLGTEYEQFIESYARERYYGLRRNPLKTTADAFEERMPFTLEPVSWAREGYYYRAMEQPGRHILHDMGAYYIQEPSAMAVAEILDPQPGERVLDLCAAPGGKSTQIAGRMAGEGLLVSNETVWGRAKILSQNIERMGVRNCVVCNETPQRLATFFPDFFDRIVVDAPCSGEGMFRKDETAVAEWSEARVSMCAERQYGILAEAAKMLRPGGVLVYSTCTFAPEEDEGVISRFLREHGQFTIEAVPHDGAFMAGRGDWIDDPAEGIAHTMRLMPYRLRGEGHYIARLRRGALPSESGMEQERLAAVRSAKRRVGDGRKGRDKSQTEVSASAVSGFLTEEIGLSVDWLERQDGVLECFGEQLYLTPRAMRPMQGMKILRAGLHLGTGRKNRIEPAHALAMALTIEETNRHLALTEEEAARYLRGESLHADVPKGWTLLTYEGYPLGFGKAADGQLKNHYPKGLRRAWDTAGL